MYQVMKREALDSLLVIFDHTPEKMKARAADEIPVSSAKTTACAAPALINICLGMRACAKVDAAHNTEMMCTLGKILVLCHCPLRLQS